MKSLPLLSLVFFSILICVSQTHGEIKLTYQTAEGPIIINGFDENKPFTYVNGKKEYLRSDGIFHLEADSQDIINHAYFPVYFTRKKDFSNRSRKDIPLEERLKTKIKTSCTIGHAITNEQQSTIPCDPVFSSCLDIWGQQLPDQLLILSAWINPQQFTHRVQLSAASKAGLINVSPPLTVSFVSEEKLYPAILLMKPDGTFAKVDMAFSGYPTWNDACFSLINDDTSRLSALLEQNNGMVNGSVFNAGLQHIAAAYGSENCLQLLLEKGSDPDQELALGLRPIHMAARTGEGNVIELLLKHGAKMKTETDDGNTALHIAATLGHLNACKVLVNAGINVNHKNRDYRTAILLAGMNDQSAIIRFLSESGAVFDFNKESRQLLLLRAIKQNDLETVKFLLSKKAKADKPTYGIYPISMAAEYASGAIIRLLIKHGADPDQKNTKGSTPLMLASSSNYDGVIALVENGADINYSTEDGVAALHLAILKNQIETTQYLLDHEADPNVKNPDGTPLIWLATETGNRIGLNALIEAGAVCQMDRETALPIMEYAFRYDIPEIVDITLSQCLEPDFNFREVFPAYWVADRYGSQTIKDLLIQHGLDPSTVEEPAFADSRLVHDQIRLVAKQDVAYPYQLQEKYGEFTAKVEGIVDIDGSFILPRLIENPVPEMDRNILEPLARWKFKPMQLDGKPVRVRFIVPIKLVPAPQEELVYEIEKVQIKPQPIKQVAPNYPTEQRKNKVRGIVVLVFVIDENGYVADVQAESATNDAFIRPAIDALLKWKFSPGYYDGEPAKVRVRMPIQFNLN